MSFMLALPIQRACELYNFYLSSFFQLVYNNVIDISYYLFNK